MANSKAYRKYAATTMAAAAAVAVAPIATSAATTFPDVSKETVPNHYDNIMKLAESGIIKGTEDGNFYPWQSIDRGQVAAMFTRAMDLEAPEDVEGSIEKYSDVNINNNYAEDIAAVTDAGVFEGTGDGKFGVWNDINRQQMAKVLVKAFDLEDINPSKDVDTDLSDVDEDNQEYVQILANLGITDATHDYKPFNDINRAEFSSMVVRTQEAVEEYENMEAEIDDVSAVNAKTLKVEFNKPLSFSDDDVKVKKGSTSANISEVNTADDKRSAEIELNSKLTEGEYNVTIERKDKDDITGSVKVENETVDNVEVLSDAAPVKYQDDEEKSEIDEAEVGYRVENQYGEDLTKEKGSSLDVAASGAANKADVDSDGNLTITGINKNAKVGDKVNLTLIDSDSGVSTTKEVTLSEEAKAAEAEFGDLYNKDDKELSRDSDLDEDKFYLPITVKDQYGKEITDADDAKEDLLLTNSNPGVVKFVKDDNDGNIDIQKVEIDDEDVLALEVSNDDFDKGIAGTTNVNAISRSTGDNARTSVEVKEGNKVSSISLDKPSDKVTEGKSVYFPLNITDKNGDDVKTKKALKDLDNSYDESVSPKKGEVVEKDDGLFLKVPGEDKDGNTIVKEGTPVTAVITANQETATQSVTPEAKAEPKVVTGLKDDASTEVRKGKKSEIKFSDLIIEDQYGQEMDKSDLDDPEVEVSVPDTDVFGFGEDGDDDTTELSKGESVDIHSTDESSKNSEKVTFKLMGEDGDADDSSAFTQKYSVASDSDFSKFEVEDIEDVYVGKDESGKGDHEAAEGYKQDIVVKAETKSGNKVTLEPDSDYSVTSSDVSIDDSDEDTYKVEGYKGNDKLDENDTVSGKIKITINETGDEYTKSVKFSNKAPKVEEAAVIDGQEIDDDEEDRVEAAADAFADGKDVELTSMDYKNGEAFDLDALLGDNFLAATDQYGVTVASEDSEVAFAEEDELESVVTFSDKSSSKIKWSGNGTDHAKVTAAEDGDDFKATVDVDGEKTNAVKIKIGGDISEGNGSGEDEEDDSGEK